MIQIIEVKSYRQLKAFIYFPFTLYENDPNWIPPLIMDEFTTLNRKKNPAFDHCTAKLWLAYQDGKIVGRVAGIINQRYIEKWGSRYARFGWLDFIEHEAVAKSLLDTVEAWAKNQGMSAIQGPMGFCDLDKEGMLVEGFKERGTFTTLYNYSYYPEILEKLGYKKDVDWMEFILDVPEVLPERIQQLVHTVRERFKLKTLNFKTNKELLVYGPAIFELLNTAYVHLYGVVPLTKKQIKFYIKQNLGFVNPAFVKLVVDARGDLAAFGISMPSLGEALKKCKGKILPFGFIHLLKARKKNDTIDLLLMAVRPDLQGKGVNTLMMDELLKSCIEHGVTTAEFNPQLEENHKVWSQWKHFNVRQHKRRRCYLKAL